MTATRIEDLPGPYVPPIPEDILDVAAVEKWMASCYPLDGETYTDAMRRLAKGMMMVMGRHLRMMQDAEIVRRLTEEDR